MVRFVRSSVGGLLAASLVLAATPAAAFAEGMAGQVPVSGILAMDVDLADAADSGGGADSGSAGDAQAPTYDILQATVKGLKSSYEFTGAKIKPSITLALDGKKVPRSAYRVKYAHNKKVGTAQVTISGRGAGTGVLIETFEIVPKATKLTHLDVVGGALVAKWKKRLKQADGYLVSYAARKDMKGAKSIAVAGKANNRLTVKGLESGKVWYVKVRTCKGTARSAWSPVAHTKIAKLGRTDLTGILSKAAASNKGTSTLKMYNSTYRLSKTKAGRRLLAYVKWLRKRYKVNIAMVDVTTGQALTFSPSRSMYSASCLKGPYVASLNKWKPYSRSSSWAMRETIVWSNNDTYAQLRETYGSETMRKMHAYAQISSSQYSIKYHYLPTVDLAKLWVGTYWYFYQDTNRNSKWARSLYTHGYNSFIYQSMRNTWKVHAKPGWYPGGGYNVQNDAGVIMAKVDGVSRPYVLAVMTSACGRYGELRRLVRLVDAVHTDMLEAGCEY
mgnify:CR=1 FL=1